ncbi:MAG TPA: hypothetical protein VIH91_08975 [Terriglobales bacterium]
MFNIRACNHNSRTLRRIWFVMEGTRPQLRSCWLIQASPDIVEDVGRGPSEDRNQPVTRPCDTEVIAVCA